MPSGILIHPVICPQQIWVKNCGGLCPFGEGAGSPPNTMWPGPKPTSMPSFILIYPTVWPQYTNVTLQTDRQDRQRSNSIWQTANRFTNIRPKVEEVNYLFQGGYVFVVVCLFVCLLAILHKNFQTGLDEIFRESWQWANEQIIKFWWRSGSQIQILIHIRGGDMHCPLPVLLVRDVI